MSPPKWNEIHTAGELEDRIVECLANEHKWLLRYWIMLVPLVINGFFANEYTGWWYVEGLCLALSVFCGWRYVHWGCQGLKARKELSAIVENWRTT